MAVGPCPRLSGVEIFGRPADLFSLEGAEGCNLPPVRPVVEDGELAMHGIAHPHLEGCVCAEESGTGLDVPRVQPDSPCGIRPTCCQIRGEATSADDAIHPQRGGVDGIHRMRMAQSSTVTVMLERALPRSLITWLRKPRTRRHRRRRAGAITFHPSIRDSPFAATSSALSRISPLRRGAVAHGCCPGTREEPRPRRERGSRPNRPLSAPADARGRTRRGARCSTAVDRALRR